MTADQYQNPQRDARAAGESAAISARGLVKTYGRLRALDGLDLAVRRGTVVGLLGPNGAGKTTAVRVFSTLLKPDSGNATVDGLDVVRDEKALRARIGVSGQYAAVDENLTGFENLDMVGRLYHLGAKKARARARRLLDLFDLGDAADRPVAGYSGGMRRRLDLAGSLVAEPRILFLDEPTTGLDPRSRMGMWDMISELVSAGTTLLLTTQYLEEADRLADRIAVINHGKVIAEGTSGELKAKVGTERLEITLAAESDVPRAQKALNTLCAGTLSVNEKTRTLSAPASDGAETLVSALHALRENSLPIVDAGIRRPTLDDVFMTLTGHEAENSDNEGGTS